MLHTSTACSAMRRSSIALITSRAALRRWQPPQSPSSWQLQQHRAHGTNVHHKPRDDPDSFWFRVKLFASEHREKYNTALPYAKAAVILYFARALLVYHIHMRKALSGGDRTRDVNDISDFFWSLGGLPFSTFLFVMGAPSSLKCGFRPLPQGFWTCTHKPDPSEAKSGN